MVYRLLLHEVGWFGKIEPASLTPGGGGIEGVQGAICISYITARRDVVGL